MAASSSSTSSNEDGNKLHSMINELEKKAQWALSNVLRLFIKNLKSSSRHLDNALAEYFNNNPDVLKNLFIKKIMMDKDKDLFYEDKDKGTILKVVKTSAFDVGVLTKLLLNIPDFETCYAKSDAKRKAKKCADPNHAKNKGCCIACDHNNGESYCKGCRRSKFICNDDKYVCCSKCTLCVCCSEMLATPKCPISRLRFALFVTHLLRNLKSHTSIESWSHISRNELIPLEFEFRAKTCDELWEVCKQQVEYLYEFLKVNHYISEADYNKHIHDIYQLEHLTATEQENIIAKEIIKKESARVIKKNLKIKLAIFCEHRKNPSYLGTLFDVMFSERPAIVFNNLFDKALDSKFVLNVVGTLKKTFSKKFSELSNKTGESSVNFEVICNGIEKHYDTQNRRDEFHLTVYIKSKNNQNLSNELESPHSDLSIELWTVFKDRMTKLTLDELNITIDLTRLNWDVGSLLMKLKITKLSAWMGFKASEKEVIAHLIQGLPDRDAFFAPYVMETTIKECLSLKEGVAVLSFNCEIYEEFKHETLMVIPALKFEEDIQKRLRRSIRYGKFLNTNLYELRSELIQYVVQDPQDLRLNKDKEDEIPKSLRDEGWLMNFLNPSLSLVARFTEIYTDNRRIAEATAESHKKETERSKTLPRK